MQAKTSFTFNAIFTRALKCLVLQRKNVNDLLLLTESWVVRIQTARVSVSMRMVKRWFEKSVILCFKWMYWVGSPRWDSLGYITFWIQSSSGKGLVWVHAVGLAYTCLLRIEWASNQEFLDMHSWNYCMWNVVIFRTCLVRPWSEDFFFVFSMRKAGRCWFWLFWCI